MKSALPPARAVRGGGLGSVPLPQGVFGLRGRGPRGGAGESRAACGSGRAGRRGRPPEAPGGADGAALPPSDDDFAALVRPHLQDVLRVARNQLGCEHLAWEAVQEALLGLWTLREVPPNPKAWLIRAVTFRSLHLGRTMRRRVRHERRASLKRRESDGDTQPSQSVASREVQTEVRGALRRLGGKHSEVLTLHLIEGMAYDAIAHRLGIPVGTVRSRLSRAREALMTHLAPDFREEP